MHFNLKPYIFEFTGEDLWIVDQQVGLCSFLISVIVLEKKRWSAHNAHNATQETIQKST